MASDPNVVLYNVFGKGNITVYFFIGRMNPPHAGHEAALRQLIKMAKEEHSIPLILLGSGPNKGESTLDNPLTPLTKQRVLKYRLADSLREIEIREKTNPVVDVSNWVEEILINTGGTGERKVVFKLVTGDKGDNATKLDGILTAIVKSAQKKGISATGESVAIKAVSTNGVEMSATQVRKDALKAYITGDGSFHKIHSLFYGPHIENVFGEIVRIAKNKSEQQLIAYIAGESEPKSTKSQKKSAKLEKSAKSTKLEKSEKSEKLEKSEKSTKSTKLEKLEKLEKSAKKRVNVNKKSNGANEVTGVKNNGPGNGIKKRKVNAVNLVGNRGAANGTGKRS